MPHRNQGPTISQKTVAGSDLGALYCDTDICVKSCTLGFKLHSPIHNATSWSHAHIKNAHIKLSPQCDHVVACKITEDAIFI